MLAIGLQGALALTSIPPPQVSFLHDHIAIPVPCPLTLQIHRARLGVRRGSSTK